MSTFAPASAGELAAWLRSGPGRVRVVGSGSRQDRLVPASDAHELRLDRLATIARLDAPDQTCSVDCGVPRGELDEALAAHGLELPCPGAGTLGGLFAADPIGASTHGGPSPRSLLLGMQAMLADGTPFQSGARVVKSVAGFDVHKLFVGSRGRLFVGTRLHLRCKPRPRASEWFAAPDLEPSAAVALLQRLRRLAVPPAALQCERRRDGSCEVRGRIAGRATFVAATLREQGLTATSPCWRDALELPAAGEVLATAVLPSRLPELLAACPPDTTLLWHGGGRAELAVATTAAGDALLRALPTLGIAAVVARGAAARRGLGTALDAGHQRLDTALHHALDPHGILA